MKTISDRITEISHQLSSELAGAISELVSLGEGLVHQVRGQRLADLAFNMIEIIDRNLYERSCDVRWWATDAAAVDALANPSAESAAHAAQRLGVILNAYTVYLDLWIADADGRVIANGRPQKYPKVIGSNVAHTSWFKAAMATSSGDDYAAFDIESTPLLDNAQVATYTTAIRAGGAADGKPLGALGIFFDWQPQAAAVVAGSQLSAEERSFTRCLLLDAQHRVIAASDGKGLLSETVALAAREKSGYFADNGRMIGYALTPGYETYRGLGWYGVIVQQVPSAG
ncbi:chemotaxis protein [Dongia sp.]|uniref:chemotaxis protein n=1 Tax=Dongia sp. TaxID=1977262 RepID=UPI0035AFDD7D